MFEVVDGDNVSGKHDPIGTVETTLGAIVGAKQQTFIADLTKKGQSKSCGKIIVRADPVKESNMEVHLKVGARGLPNSGGCLCSNNNVLFEIYRSTPAGDSFLKVYDSDPIASNLNPSFPALKISGQQLCNSNKNLGIQIRFYNQEAAQRVLLCQCTVTLTELLDKKQYELRNTVTNQAAGVLNIEQVSVVEKPTFIEYL